MSRRASDGEINWKRNVRIERIELKSVGWIGFFFCLVEESVGVGVSI